MDTIFAETTPRGRGGVSVIRISGAQAFDIARKIVGSLPEPRRAALRRLSDDDDYIDTPLVLCFEQGQSFTGEDTVEFHLHGAPTVVRRVEAALVGRGLRRALPGEFTRRAFVNGRMDLVSAESLSDLLASETEEQRKLANRNLSGELQARAKRWRDSLIRAGGLLAAGIDFADEEIPDSVISEVDEILTDVLRQLKDEYDGYPAAESIREGFQVAVIGPVNAGKSSFINAVAKRDVSIVTSSPGTTRDIIELRTELDGYAVTFLDTAGLRETNNTVELIGIERARDRAARADLRLHLSDDGEVDEALWQDGDLRVLTKADITGAEGAISSATGAGVGALLHHVGEVLSRKVANAGCISHLRQAEMIKAAYDSLHPLGDEPEIVAENLRHALVSLDRLFGRVDVEDFLDVVFSNFCVGK